MEKREKKKRRKGVIILVLLGLTLGLGGLTCWLGASAARERPIPEPMTGDCITAGCHDAAGNADLILAGLAGFLLFE